MTYGDFVQFVLARWPAEGWILGRGESEFGEAEDGFVRGDTYGAFRARRVYCEDGWSEILLALGARPAERHRRQVDRMTGVASAR